uniref:Uncharacterized protein n=1 Tax=Panagrolaimus superbus TaxID=310955 RepID=A0A914Z9S7_9BILA
MSQKLLTFACLALLVTVGLGKDEIKNVETKKTVKNVSVPVVVETETVETRKTVGSGAAAAAAIGSGTSGTYSCYQCNSATMGEEECESTDLEVLSKFNKPCTGIPKGSSLQGITTAVQCRKIEQDVEGEKKRIIRECAYTGGEEELDGKKRTGNKGIYMYFYTCNNTMVSEPCNPAPQAILSLGTLVVVAIAQFFHYF